MNLLVLLLPCLTQSAFLGVGSKQPHWRLPLRGSSCTETAHRQPPPVATLAKPMRIATRPLLVPALSYGGLAAVAYGASKAVALAGYSGATIMGLPLPMATVAAIAAPALLMFIELLFLGGGKRVAQMMGGTPADARLTELVSDVAHRAGLAPPANVFVIPTDELNAFAAGFGSGDATVAVTSGLRRALSDTELEAVIAHEIGHIRHSDMATNMHVAVAIAGLAGIYEIGRLLAQSETSSRARDDDDDNGGSALPLGYAMMAGGLAAKLGAHLLQLSMSRSAEYDADSVAAELCGSTAMISALEKIQREADVRKRREQQRGSSPKLWGKKEEAATPALASFRSGAFAHSYISNGETSDAHEKGSANGWWAGIKTAFSTHPTTERRIEALKEKFILPPYMQ